MLYIYLTERGWQAQGFDWDDDNEEHIARHGVTPGEAEEVFSGRIHARRVARGRYFVLGRTGDGRYLVVVVARLGAGWLRVITARDMVDRERRQYQRRRK